MKIKLKLVKVGMNMQEATIAEWFIKPGETFSKGTPLYSIETEKVSQDVEATHDGQLIEILIGKGRDAQVGEAVAVVETDPPTK